MYYGEFCIALQIVDWNLYIMSLLVEQVVSHDWIHPNRVYDRIV